MVDWRRAVVFTHRWLGIGGCLLFIAWFASGIVMMYARMPELTSAERSARLPPLDLSTARVAPSDAFGVARDGLAFVRIGMLTGRPVYRSSVGGEAAIAFADTGERFAGLSREAALDEARRFAPDSAATLRYDARLVEPDQWTVQHSRSLPMHRISLGGDEDAKLYYAERTGELVVKTTAGARRVAYAGAVLHWLYFTPLRKHHVLWTRTIIALSALGAVMCALGLVWGVYNCRRSPFRGWLRWHHYIGLFFGAFSFAWIFSGLLSVDPLDWHADTTPTAEQRRAFAGGALPLHEVTISGIAAQLPAGAKEVEILAFRGRPRTLVDGRATVPLDDREIADGLAAAMPVAPVDVARLSGYDLYYYDRDGELPLPVVRARYGDPPATWLYVDPNRGVIARKEERSSRVNRWLYHGLHSLDVPFLYRRRPLWDIVMILLILGGMGSAVTAIVPASRRLWRHVHRWL